MIFLIEYDRPSVSLITFKSFDDRDRATAENLRLEMELDLNRRGVQHEVVLLEAASEEAVRRTHRRYFESARQILGSSIG